MRLSSVALCSLLAVASASAQEVSIDQGTPAALATGSSSTTLSILGKPIATVGGEGDAAARTRSGTITADGSATVTAGDLSLTAGGELPALRLDNNGDGVISADERAAAARFSDSSKNCDASIASSAGALSIRAVDENDLIELILVCAKADTLSADERVAIGENSALMQLLNAGGYGPSDVVAIRLDASGAGTLYLNAA